MPDLEFSKEQIKDPSRNEGCEKVRFEPGTPCSIVQHSNHWAPGLQLPNGRKIFFIYALCLLMYNVGSPDPDPNPWGAGQLPNPKSAILC